MTATITKSDLERWRALGACAEGLEWSARRSMRCATSFQRAARFEPNCAVAGSVHRAVIHRCPRRRWSRVADVSFMLSR